jgi:hypothetical protein
MAGSLIKINEAVADGTSSTLSVTGIDSNDVYVVYGYNITPTTSTASMYARVTKSGTQDSTANYDYAVKLMNTGSAFQNLSNTNQTLFEILSNQVTGAGKSDTILFYLFNFNSSSEYSFITMENIRVEGSGWMGGGVHTVASSSDGIGILPNVGNVGSGSKLVLYKIKST